MLSWWSLSEIEAMQVKKLKIYVVINLFTDVVINLFTDVEIDMETIQTENIYFTKDILVMGDRRKENRRPSVERRTQLSLVIYY